VQLRALKHQLAGSRRQLGSFQALHLYALLFRSQMVVLLLHFEESEVARTQVSPHPHLRSRCPSAMMLHILRIVVRVEISGAVRTDTVGIDLLHVVFLLHQTEHVDELPFRCHKLGVDAVHQLDTTHLVETDGIHRRKQFRYVVVIVRHSEMLAYKPLE